MILYNEYIILLVLYNIHTLELFHFDILELMKIICIGIGRKLAKAGVGLYLLGANFNAGFVNQNCTTFSYFLFNTFNCWYQTQHRKEIKNLLYFYSLREESWKRTKITKKIVYL